MKRNYIICVLVGVLILLLTSCGCKHEWNPATCSAPKTCQLCGETEGETLHHTWQAATCAQAKTCAICSATEGDPLPHTWQDAICTQAKTCAVCQTTEGEPLPHTWQNATCTEVKTCTVCQTTEGEPLGHTWQEATCTAPKTCTVCKITEGKTASHKWAGATCKKAGVCSVCGTTGAKGKHDYSVVIIKEFNETFAGQRVKTCKTCNYEVNEYYTDKTAYDLDAIAQAVGAYAKQKGFRVSYDTGKKVQYKYAKDIYMLNITEQGQDKFISSAKALVDSANRDYGSSPAGPGAYTLHISAYYTESGAIGAGFIGVTIDVTS